MLNKKDTNTIQSVQFDRMLHLTVRLLESDFWKKQDTVTDPA